MRIGVDLGGTKIEAIALADDGAVAARRRVPTPRDDYAATLDAVARLVLDLERDAGGEARSASGCRARSRPPPAGSRTRTPSG